MKQKKAPKQAFVPTHSILTKVVWQAMLLTTFIVVLLAALSFVVSRAMLQRTIEANLSTVASLSEDALQNALSSGYTEAAFLSSKSDVQSALAGDAASIAQAEELFELFVADSPYLQGVAVYSDQGILFASSGAEFAEVDRNLIRGFRAQFSSVAWDSYDLVTTVRFGSQEGFLVMRYIPLALISSVRDALSSLGKTGEVLLVHTVDGQMEGLRVELGLVESVILPLAVYSDSDHPLSRLSRGEEGVTRAYDYHGNDAIIAYRYIPALGWGLIMKVNRAAALRSVFTLGITQIALGVLLLVLAGVLAYVLAKQLTKPIESLAVQVTNLRPGAWEMKRTVHTGDEVEVLDRRLSDMAERLKNVYLHQEEEIAERTKALTAQYALDSAILEHIGYGVIAVNAEGVITDVNPAAEEVFGKPEGALASQHIEDVFILRTHQDKPLSGQHPVHAAMQTGEPQRSDLTAHVNLQCADGTLMPVSYAITPIKEEGGAPTGAIVVFQDVSEERRVDYLKSEFISLASHQLRTPLSALSWYVELINDDSANLSEDQKGYVAEMDHSLKRMTALLTSLLHAAKVEGADLKPEIEDIDLMKLLDEMHGECQTLFKDANMGCELKAPKGSVQMRTDPTLLRIVIQNLVTNAIKYTPHTGGKKVHVTVEEAPNDMVEIRVQDEGMGIPKREQERVFQKFFRASNVKKMDTDGNGLGLHITHSIVERLGGTITFTSEENKGTLFVVKLPKSSN